MGVRGIAAHVDADLGKNALGAEVVEAREGLYDLGGLMKGIEIALHLLVDPCDRPIEGVDLLEMELEQEAVVGRQPASRMCPGEETVLLFGLLTSTRCAGSPFERARPEVLSRVAEQQTVNGLPTSPTSGQPKTGSMWLRLSSATTMPNHGLVGHTDQPCKIISIGLRDWPMGSDQRILVIRDHGADPRLAARRLNARPVDRGPYVFPSRVHDQPHVTARQYARIVHGWIEGGHKVARSAGWGVESRYGSSKFAVTVVQCDSRRSSGPHPIRRSAPPSPASWRRGCAAAT